MNKIKSRTSENYTESFHERTPNRADNSFRLRCRHAPKEESRASVQTSHTAHTTHNSTHETIEILHTLCCVCAGGRRHAMTQHREKTQQESGFIYTHIEAAHRISTRTQLRMSSHRDWSSAHTFPQSVRQLLSFG